MNHPPEPWSFGEIKTIGWTNSDTLTIGDAEQMPVCACRTREGMERIIACVNFCERATTVWLEAGKLKFWKQRMIYEERQKATISAEKVEEWMQAIRETEGPAGMADPPSIDIAAALAELKEFHEHKHAEDRAERERDEAKARFDKRIEAGDFRGAFEDLWGREP